MSLEKEMATDSSILAGKFHGEKRLAGCSPWGHKRVAHELATKATAICLCLPPKSSLPHESYFILF